MTENLKLETTYGFLTIVQVDQLGFCGGLLVLTSRGRPLEFHCTAPVAANRAQEILYGQTLKQFVCCDQIGVSLVNKAKSKLDVILVDEREFLPVGELLPTPVLAVTNSDSQVVDSDQDQRQDSRYRVLQLDDHRVEYAGAQSDEVELIVSQFVRNLPASEPFERIRLAISEAHAGAA